MIFDSGRKIKKSEAKVDAFLLKQVWVERHRFAELRVPQIQNSSRMPFLCNYMGTIWWQCYKTFFLRH
jgi:hypothetical protein